MANEAKLVQRLQDRLSQGIVAEDATILKGTILQIGDANVLSASSADGEFFGGIAYADKVADDGSTTLAVWTKGVFDMKLTTATIAAGEPVKIAGANLVAIADDDTAANSNEIIGYALQDGANDEVIEVRLK